MASRIQPVNRLPGAAFGSGCSLLPSERMLSRCCALVDRQTCQWRTLQPTGERRSKSRPQQAELGLRSDLLDDVILS